MNRLGFSCACRAGRLSIAISGRCHSHTDCLIVLGTYTASRGTTPHRRRLFHPLKLRPIEPLHRVSVHLPQEFHKHVKPFGLILQEGIFLTIGSQVNSFTQLIHGVKMIFPFSIYSTQYNITFKRAHGLSRNKTLPRRIDCFTFFHNHIANAVHGSNRVHLFVRFNCQDR